MEDSKGYFGLIYEYYHKLLAREIILAYDGDVTHQVMKAFTSLVEEKLENEKEKEPIRRRLFHVLVECLQNINRHGEVMSAYSDESDRAGKGALLVSKTDEYYRVITVNMMLSSQKKKIVEFLEYINPLDDEALLELYKKQLDKGKLSDRGGAGLGFIDVRRKTGNKLEYNIIDHNDTYCYFLFNVLISR